MWDKLEAVSRRVEEITRLLGDPGMMGNSRELQKLGRELAELRRFAEAYVRDQRSGQERARVPLRAVPLLPYVRRDEGLEGGDARPQRDGPWRDQGGHRDDRGEGRLQPAEIRERRSPGPARACHGGGGGEPHLYGGGGGDPGGRGGRRPDRSPGPPPRRVPLLARPRAGAEHDGLGGP